MNLKMIEDNYIGTNMTIVTRSGNKIQGEVLKTTEDDNIVKFKTESGIIMINADAIESIY